MALQMPTNITPDVLSGFGGGVFDAASGLEVSWQVNGGPYMSAYRVDICENNASSTQVYTTGKKTLGTPFYGVLPNGAVNIFSVEIPAASLAAAGIENGNEYKMYITQWWGASDAESVTQQSASIIQALSAPVVSVDEFAYPITSREYTFTGTYSQAQGDGIAWVRWVLYNAQDGNAVDDTGEVYGTSVLQYSYDSFLQGTIYEIEVIAQTQSGQRAYSGKRTITVSYPIDMGSGLVTATQECGWNGISVSWDRPGVDGITGYSIYRLDNTSREFLRLVSLPEDHTKLIDYSAKNGHSYTYQLWTEGSGTFLERPVASNQITPCRWNVLLIAAKMREDGAYHPEAIYTLACNLQFGEESNNSNNSFDDTFSGYPAYQQSSNRYRSGRITALVGKIDPKTNEYIGDTAVYVDELMALTTSDAVLFLRDRKGSFRNIRINGPITSQVQSAYPNQATVVNFPWVEVADAANTNVLLAKGDALWPYDEVVDTTIDVDVATGMLVWTRPDGYTERNRGSMLSVGENGHMLQTLDSTIVQKASMRIDPREHLIAEQ